MGRYDFRPARVLRSVTQLLETKSMSRPPPWLDIVQDIPPPQTQTLVRLPKRRRRSKMFVPCRISYKEDALRLEFFGDHPWELARPKVVLEDSGNDSKSYDWSRLQQPGKRLDGESVIQRQRWLMEHEECSSDLAYDKARKEFYAYRLYEDTERKVAREEALHYGGYFGKGPNEIGMELENEQWESWKAWAVKQAEERRASAEIAFTGTGSDEDIARFNPAEKPEELDADGVEAEDLNKEVGEELQKGTEP